MWITITSRILRKLKGLIISFPLFRAKMIMSHFPVSFKITIYLILSVCHNQEVAVLQKMDFMVEEVVANMLVRIITTLFII